MKNIIANGAVLMIAPMFLFSCSVQSKQSKDSEMNAENAVSVQEQQKDSMLSTLELDGMKVTWIRDNANDRLMPRSLFPDATDAQIDSLSLQNGVPASISTFLVETDGKRILFDAGMGAPDSKLFEGLKSLNINPADIDYLFITHFHGDHIGGMMKDGVAVFPNAEVYASKVEYDAWMKIPADKKSQVENTMKAYKDHLHLFAFGDTLPCDVVAMEAAGHTPGHTVFRTGNLLVIGDLMHGAALQLKYPEICDTYDMDKAGAVKSRKHYVQYFRENGLVMAGNASSSTGIYEMIILTS